MIPSVEIKKQDGQTGSVPPGPEGILAIIAPAKQGPSYAQSFARPDLAFTAYNIGKLAEDAAYQLGIGKPVVLVRPTTSIAGTYSAVEIARVGSSTSAPTANAAEPQGEFDCAILITKGGTRGVDGIEYQVAVDAAAHGAVESSTPNYTGVKRLGTAVTIEIFDPRGVSTGAKIDLAAGTLDAGDLITFSLHGPKMNSGDLTNALEALRVAKLPWECVLIDGIDADDTVVGALDLWLEAREAEGKFKMFATNTRLKGPSESEGAYRNAMQTVAANMASIRGAVGSDGGALVSPLRGVRMPTPTSVALCRRLMSQPVSVDAARVKDGPIAGFKLEDVRGNPKYHDERMTPGLDDLRLVAMRSFEDRDGAFINNPVAISSTGSDYVYVQHIRVMNKACARAFFLLEGLLSDGVQADLTTNPLTILESEAAHIEELINDDLQATILRPRDVSAIVFELSRVDDLSSNSGAILTGTVSLIGLKYIKKFSVNARYVRSLAGG